MFAEKRIIAIIPARGGSKGIPKKNTTILNGKPLIYYTIQSAKASKYLDAMYVSTEDRDIADLGMELGADVIRRPARYATDKARGVDVIKHALKHLAKLHQDFDVVVLLQPTSPLRVPSDIDNCIEMLVKNNLDSVVSVVRVHQHPNWMFRMNARKRITPISSKINTRRQQHEELYYPNGAVFVSTTKFIDKQKEIMYGGKCGGYLMDKMRSIDIDTPYDLEVCTFLLSRLALHKE